jgi:RNA polymerase sigma-70 factor, ECF subfamily
MAPRDGAITCEKPARSGDGLTSVEAASARRRESAMTRQARSRAAMSSKPAESPSVHVHMHETDTVSAVPESPESTAPGDSWDLVHAAQQGDTDAFADLYDRYVDVVFRYVLFRVGDRELAEDVTSETFLRALRRITSVSYQGRDVGAWFVTIARNLVLDHVKSSRFRLEIATAEVDSQKVESGPEQEVMSRVTTDALLECVQQLGDDQRECIVLRFLQGLSVAETAEIMNRNEGAVKALQHRAVRRLAQLLPAELR